MEYFWQGMRFFISASFHSLILSVVVPWANWKRHVLLYSLNCAIVRLQFGKTSLGFNRVKLYVKTKHHFIVIGAVEFFPLNN